MTENTLYFDFLADSVDTALDNGEQEWLNCMSNVPGRGIRRGYHFCGRTLLDYDEYYSNANTGSIHIALDLSTWDNGVCPQIVPPQFIKKLSLKNHRPFSAKILDSITLDDTGVTCAEVSVKVDELHFDLWEGGGSKARFAYSMSLARLATAEFCDQQGINRTTAGEVIEYSDMNPERNEVRVKVVAGPFETMRKISDVLNGSSGVGRVCRFVTDKNLMVKGLDHDTSKEQLKRVLKSRYKMMEWCSQAESFLPVSVFAHHKECLCWHCEYEHYTKISKQL